MGRKASASALCVLAAALVVGCSASPASSGSFAAGASIAPGGFSSLAPTGPSAPASFVPTPTFVLAPTPVLTVAPTWSPNPGGPRPTDMAPLPGVPFDIAWRSSEPRAVPFSDSYLDQLWGLGLVRWHKGAVAWYRGGSGEGSEVGPMIWRSSDLVEWHRVATPESGAGAIDVEQLLVGGPGLVALGRAWADGRRVLLSSADGERWTSIDDVPPIQFIWARPGVVVGYGAETWVTRNGEDWSSAGPSPLPGDGYQSRVRVLDLGETAVAFVPREEASTAVFRLWDDGRWGHVSDITGWVDLSALGPNGIVAIGGDARYRPTAWLSPDGKTWASGRGPSDARTLVVTSAGYVATGQRIYMDGCDGLPLAEQVAQTWTSHDGLTWRQMPEQLLLDHTVVAFVVPDGGRLVAVGLRWSGSFAGDDHPTFEPVTFEAALPQPEPSHTPLPVAHGCGE